MLNAFLPKGAPFFEYLRQQNEIMCSICALASRLFGEGGDPDSGAAETELHQEVARLEDEGNDLYVKLVKDLSQSFITPIDREDILRIAKEHEATVDLLQNLVARIYFLNADNTPFPMRRLAENLNAMAQLTRSMLAGLARKKDSHDTRAFRALLNECEMLVGSGLTEALDAEGMSAAEVLHALRLSRAYDRMEQVVAQITELAEAIEEAVLKNV